MRERKLKKGSEIAKNQYLEEGKEWTLLILV